MTFLTWPGACLADVRSLQSDRHEFSSSLGYLRPPFVFTELSCYSLNVKCRPSQANVCERLLPDGSYGRAYGLYSGLCSGLTCLIAGPEI